MRVKRPLIALASTLLLALNGCGILHVTWRDKGPEKSWTDEGIQSPLHQENQGKIVFAKAEIPRDATASFALAEKFSLGDQIFARAYLAKSPGNLIAAEPDPNDNCRWDNRRELTLYASIDGGEEHGLEWHGAGEKTWTTYTTFQLTDEKGALLPSEQVVMPQHRHKLAANLALRLAVLPDGEHTLTIRSEASCSSRPKHTLAKGDLKITVDAAGRSALAKKIRLAVAGMKSTPEEVKRLGNAAEAQFSAFKMLHFRVIEDAFRVERNALGEPLARKIIAMMLLQEGNKCTLRSSEIVENNEGGGRYGAPRFVVPLDGALGEMTDMTVPCDIDVSK